MDNDVQFKEWRPSQEWKSEKAKPGFGNKLANLITKLSGGKMDEKQVNYVILALVAIIFIISFVIFLNAL